MFYTIQQNKMKEILLASLASLLIILAPIKGLMVTMLLAVLFDTISGVWVSVKIGGWSTFRSNKLFNIVIKLFFYLLAIIFAFVVDVNIFDGSIFGVKLLLAKIITASFVWIEFVSLNENNMKLGNRSLFVILKEMISKATEIKKDLADVEVKPKD
jgi:hypothetical protein